MASNLFLSAAAITDTYNYELNHELTSHDMVYAIQEKAWDNTETMPEWIEKVWHPFSMGKHRPTYTNIYDLGWVFYTHEKEYHPSENSGMQVDVIPYGYTGKMQILDKGINKPFKEKVQVAHIEQLLVNNGNPKWHGVARWINRHGMGLQLIL